MGANKTNLNLFSEEHKIAVMEKGGGMTELANVNLKCCGEKISIPFIHSESPALPASQFRKNVSCPSCAKTVIVTLTRTLSGEQKIEQEVIHT